MANKILSKRDKFVSECTKGEWEGLMYTIKNKWNKTKNKSSNEVFLKYYRCRSG